MLSDDDVQALVQARHGDPFSRLGLHADADGALWIRALLPRATAVALHETENHFASGTVADLVRGVERLLADKHSKAA